MTSFRWRAARRPVSSLVHNLPSISDESFDDQSIISFFKQTASLPFQLTAEDLETLLLNLHSTVDGQLKMLVEENVRPCLELLQQIRNSDAEQKLQTLVQQLCEYQNRLVDEEQFLTAQLEQAEECIRQMEEEQKLLDDKEIAVQMREICAALQNDQLDLQSSPTAEFEQVLLRGRLVVQLRNSSTNTDADLLATSQTLCNSFQNAWIDKVSSFVNRAIVLESGGVVPLSEIDRRHWRQTMQICCDLDQLNLLDRILIEQIVHPLVISRIKQMASSRSVDFFDWLFASLIGCYRELFDSTVIAANSQVAVGAIFQPVFAGLVRELGRSQMQFFSAADPIEFAKRFKSHERFLSKLNESLKGLHRSVDSFEVYQKSWQLDVYFVLCFKQIANKIETIDWMSEEEDITTKLMVNYDLIRKDMYLHPLHADFARLILQMLARSMQLFSEQLKRTSIDQIQYALQRHSCIEAAIANMDDCEFWMGLESLWKRLLDLMKESRRNVVLNSKNRLLEIIKEAISALTLDHQASFDDVMEIALGISFVDLSRDDWRSLYAFALDHTDSQIQLLQIQSDQDKVKHDTFKSFVIKQMHVFDLLI